MPTKSKKTPAKVSKVKSKVSTKTRPKTVVKKAKTVKAKPPVKSSKQAKAVKSVSKKTPKLSSVKKKTAIKTPVKKVSKLVSSKKATKIAPKASKAVVSKQKPKKMQAKKEVKKGAVSLKTPVKTQFVKTTKPALTQKTNTPVKAKTITQVKKINMEVKPQKTPAIKPVKLKAVPTSIFGLTPYLEKKGEEYMNDKQQAHFREILLRWKSELMEEVDRTMHHMQDDAQRFPDPIDSATQEEEFSLELRARDRERKLIKKIDETLAHIEQNNYGYCDACGVEIGIRRLEARPTANLCIDCKTLDEIKEKQTRA